MMAFWQVLWRPLRSFVGQLFAPEPRPVPVGRRHGGRWLDGSSHTGVEMGVGLEGLEGLEGQGSIGNSNIEQP